MNCQTKRWRKLLINWLVISFVQFLLISNYLFLQFFTVLNPFMLDIVENAHIVNFQILREEAIDTLAVQTRVSIEEEAIDTLAMNWFIFALAIRFHNSCSLWTLSRIHSKTMDAWQRHQRLHHQSLSLQHRQASLNNRIRSGSEQRTTYRMI